MSIVKRNQRKALESKLIGIDLGKGKDTSAVMVIKRQDKALTGKPDDSRVHAIMDEFDFFKVAMESDLAQLKKFSDIADKADYKRQALEEHQYLDYLRRYQAAAANHPNMVFAWVVIWLVDLGRWKTAFEFLPLLVEQQQNLPTAFKTKDWPTFIVDQLYDEGASHLVKGRDEIERSQVIHLFIDFITLLNTNQWPVSELIGGKLYAMAAKLEQAVFNLGNAYTYGMKATEINDKAGVKKMVKEIAKVIGKETDS